MATISPVKVSTPHDGSVRVIRWASVTENDTCTAYPCAFKGDRSIHVHGTFGGATVQLHGRNNPNTSTRARLSTPGPTAELISVTSEALKQVLEMSYDVQPVASGGTGQSLTIDLIIIGQRT